MAERLPVTIAELRDWVAQDASFVALVVGLCGLHAWETRRNLSFPEALADIVVRLPDVSSLSQLSQAYWPVVERLCALEALTFRNAAARDEFDQTAADWSVVRAWLEKLMGLNSERLHRILAGIAVAQREWFLDVGFSDLGAEEAASVLGESPVYSMKDLLPQALEPA